MTTPETTTGEEAPSWEQLPAWLRESLASPALRYTHYLPIQKIVVPILDRALTSYLPMDVCLSAPTGSGKTLCYLLPMVNLIAKQKRELAETAVRGVVLVPTKALGAQVYHVAKAMTAGSPISVVSCCGDAQRRESGSLVKEVRLPFVNMSSSTLLSSASKQLNGEEEALEEEDDEVKNKNRIDDDNDDGNENDLEALLRTAESVLKNQRPARTEKGKMTADAEDEEEEGASSNSLLYLARADIIIATPQRLLRHLGSTPGFTLKDLRMLVIDEADQLMTGAFTSFVSRIVRTFEESSSLSSSSLGNRGEAMSERRVLHKVLCSATLSAHTARISDIRLRNCRYFSLDTDGSTRALVDANVTETATGDMSHVSSKFSLPPGLEERVLALSKDEARHGVLLKLIRHLDQKRTEERQREEANHPSEGNRGDDRLTVLPTTIGQSIVVFCATGEVVRVLTKFLCAAGLAAFEFTALSTELERRRAILAAVAGKPSILVTTDALMRGVDLPGVGYVVMYDAPRSLQQYVHRVGRTARALRRGSAYMILSKKGPSGTQSDGEVASFLALDRYLKRSQPVQYEYELKRLTDEEMEEANALLQATQRELQGMLRNTLQQRAVVVNAAPVNNNNGNSKGVTATPGGAAASSSATAIKRPREGEESSHNNNNNNTNKSNNHNQHSNRNWGNSKKFPPTQQGHQHRPPRQQQA